MTETTHLNLSVTEHGEDLPFLEWRKQLTDATDSNMVKLDDAYGEMRNNVNVAKQNAIGGLDWDPNTNSLILLNLDGTPINIVPVRYSSMDPIEITKFTNASGTVEYGNIVRNVTFTMTFSEEAVSVTLNGEEIEIGSTYVLANQEIASTTTFTLVATDRWGNVDSATTTISFAHGLYYGKDVAIDEFTSAWVLSLSKRVKSNRTTTFAVNALDGEYVYFALPTSYGVPTFKVGGFAGGFAKVGELLFENSYKVQEPYSIYRSDNEGLVNLTVEVS